MTSEIRDDLEYRQRSFMSHAIKTGRIAVLLVAIWLFTGGSFWPIWPIAFLAFGLVKRAQRLNTDSEFSTHGRHRRHSCFL